MKPRGRKLVAVTMWALSVSAYPAFVRGEPVTQKANESLRLFASPVVLNDEQWILMSVVPVDGSAKGTRVSKRMSFQPVDVRPEDRDVWVDVRPKGKLPRGRRAPDFYFSCSNQTPPHSQKHLIEIQGSIGLTKLLPIECYRLSAGSQYEVIVHWKTTVPAEIRFPEDLFVEELVSEPFTYTHLGLFEKKRSAPARLEQSGLALAKVRGFLKELVSRANKRDWSAVCAMATKPFRARIPEVSDGSYDRPVDNEEDCKKLMPHVAFGLHPNSDPEPFHNETRDPLALVQVRRQGDFTFGRFVFAGVCPPGAAACGEKTPKIVWVAARGTPGSDNKGSPKPTP